MNMMNDEVCCHISAIPCSLPHSPTITALHYYTLCSLHIPLSSSSSFCSFPCTVSCLSCLCSQPRPLSRPRPQKRRHILLIDPRQGKKSVFQNSPSRTPMTLSLFFPPSHFACCCPVHISHIRSLACGFVFPCFYFYCWLLLRTRAEKPACNAGGLCTGKGREDGGFITTTTACIYAVFRSRPFTEFFFFFFLFLGSPCFFPISPKA